MDLDEKRGGNRGDVACVCVCVFFFLFFFPLAVSRQEAGVGEGGAAAVISTVMWKWKLLSILHGGRADADFYFSVSLCHRVLVCMLQTHSL